jgi:hypothetical protein
MMTAGDVGPISFSNSLPCAGTASRSHRMRASFDFAVRVSAVRQRADDGSQAETRPAITLRAETLPASTASRPAFVTIANSPSVGWDAEGSKVDLGRAGTEIFSGWGWTGESAATAFDAPCYRSGAPGAQRAISAPD